MSAETNTDRAERYLRMATETAALAQRASDPSIAEAYMHMAEVWMKMAEEAQSRLPANDERDEGGGDPSRMEA